MADIGESISAAIRRIRHGQQDLIKLLKNVNFASVKKTDPRPATAEIEEIILLVKDVTAEAKVTRNPKEIRPFTEPFTPVGTLWKFGMKFTNTRTR